MNVGAPPILSALRASRREHLAVVAVIGSMADSEHEAAARLDEIAVLAREQAATFPRRRTSERERWLLWGRIAEVAETIAGHLRQVEALRVEQ